MYNINKFYLCNWNIIILIKKERERKDMELDVIGNSFLNAVLAAAERGEALAFSMAEAWR